MAPYLLNITYEILPCFVRYRQPVRGFPLGQEVVDGHLSDVEGLDLLRPQIVQVLDRVVVK